MLTVTCFHVFQEKSRITVTGRDVAGNSPVRTSSQGITGSTRATGPFSAKNATGPSPGQTILRCTWNGIYRTGRWTSKPSVAFEQKSTKLELHDILCCPQDQGWDRFFFFFGSCFSPFVIVVFQNAGDSVNFLANWDVTGMCIYLLTTKLGRAECQTQILEIYYEYQGYMETLVCMY